MNRSLAQAIVLLLIGACRCPAAVNADTNAAGRLFFRRDGKPCHTNAYASQRLVWAPASQLKNVIAVHPHPERSATVLALTADGMHRSDDFGASWQRLPLTGAPAADRATALAFQPGESETFCLGTSRSGVWISRDGGRTVQRIGSAAGGMASDHVEQMIYAAGAMPRRTLLVSHGLEGRGVSRGNTGDGTWAVTAADYHVVALHPMSGRSLCVFAATPAEPALTGIYYAAVLDGYWHRLLGDVLPTSAAWVPAQSALLIATRDRGLVRLAGDGSAVVGMGGDEHEWLSVGSTWNAHADRAVAYFYGAEQGVLWTTGTVAAAVDQSQGLFRGGFVGEGAHVKAAAGGLRFYAAINGTLWIGRDGSALRVEAVTVSPAAVLVSAGAMNDGYWKALDEALHSFTTASSAAPGAARLATVLRERNHAISNGHVRIRAAVAAADGRSVTADLSRFGLPAATLLEQAEDATFGTEFDLQPEMLIRMAQVAENDWRPGYPGPLPISVSASAPGSAPAAGTAVLAFHLRPQDAAYGRDHWALHFGHAEGRATFACERLRPEQYWIPMHQRLSVGPGPWSGVVWNYAARINVADYAAMTFLLRADGPADAELSVQLCDQPPDALPSRTPLVPLVAGGFVEGGAITSEYRRVTVPVAVLLKHAGRFNPELFSGVGFAGDSASPRTYFIDDWRFTAER